MQAGLIGITEVCMQNFPSLPPFLEEEGMGPSVNDSGTGINFSTKHIFQRQLDVNVPFSNLRFIRALRSKILCHVEIEQTCYIIVICHSFIKCFIRYD